MDEDKLNTNATSETNARNGHFPGKNTATKSSEHMHFDIHDRIRKLEKKWRRSRKLLYIVITILIGILLILIIVKVTDNIVDKAVLDTANSVENINESGQADQEKILKDVTKLIMLPTNEAPIISIINNADELIKEQPFFTGAQNGDILLGYRNSLKAIIYSPSRNLIVNAGPIVLNEPVATTTTKVAPKKK